MHASRLLSRVENTAYTCAPRHAWHRYRRGVRLSGFSYRAISSCKFQAWQWRRRRCPIEPLERRKETYRRAIIYLRNVFIEYYAAQVGNLVHGYAINERRSERDTGRGGGGRPRERLEVRGGDARGRGGIAGAETIIRGGVRGGGSRGKE